MEPAHRARTVHEDDQVMSLFSEEPGRLLVITVMAVINPFGDKRIVVLPLVNGHPVWIIFGAACAILFLRWRAESQPTRGSRFHITGHYSPHRHEARCDHAFCSGKLFKSADYKASEDKNMRQILVSKHSFVHSYLISSLEYSSSFTPIFNCS